MRACPFKLKFVYLTSTLFCLASTVSQAGPIDVFILAGQSNAAGRALAADLSTDLDSVGVPYDSYAANSDLLLYANREREVTDLSIIHDQPWGDLRKKSPIIPWRGELGPEMSLARDLVAAVPNPVAFIKYTIGGTNIERWNNPADLYTPFFDYLNEMKAELTAAGHTVRWRGAFWVQGESDTYTGRARFYNSTFNSLFDQLRVDLDATDMPVVVAQLKSNLEDVESRHYSTLNPGARLINSDMLQLATVDPLVAITPSSNDLLVQDGIHYTADSYIELGHRLADTFLNTWQYSADFNGDLVVNGTDFLIWQRNLVASGDSLTHNKGDANQDGVIDELDLKAWEAQFDEAPSLIVSADFNDDSVIDGTDFLIWQRNLGKIGASATHNNGDANGDARIDQFDFKVWESQLTGTVNFAAATTIIPEPSSLLLVITASLIACLWYQSS